MSQEGENKNPNVDQTNVKKGVIICPIRIQANANDDETRVVKAIAEQWVACSPQTNCVRKPDFEGEKPILMIIPITTRAVTNDSDKIEQVSPIDTMQQ